MGYWSGVANEIIVGSIRDALAEEGLTQPHWWILNHFAGAPARWTRVTRPDRVGARTSLPRTHPPILYPARVPDTTPGGGVMLGLLRDLLGGLLGGLAGNRIVKKRGERLAKDGKVECGLRVLSGSHPRVPAGLWMHSTAQLSPGLIKMGGIVVRITKLDASAPRRPKGREVWSVSPRTAIVRIVASTGAVLEWAVLAEQLPWALEQVQGAV